MRSAVLLLACATGAAQEPVGELFSSSASVHGSVVLTGKGAGVVSGSTVSAGSDTAVLRLSRGGQVSICPGTSLNVTTSASGRSLMLSLSTGAIETEYSLPASVDTLLTPDLRIQLTGPGLFRYAISSDQGGNVCVRALPGNTAAVIVHELMGEGSYQVKHDESVIFRRGDVTQASDQVPHDCGCPAAPIPVLRAAGKLPERVADPMAPPAVSPSQATEARPQDEARIPVAVAARAAAQLPESLRQPLYDNVYVQVEAPFVFRAEDAIPPAMDLTVARLTLRRASLAQVPAAIEPVVAARVAARVTKPSRPRRGFFSRLGSFFAGIFGGRR